LKHKVIIPYTDAQTHFIRCVNEGIAAINLFLHQINFMYQLLKPLLFKLDPEKAHRLVFSLIWLAFQIPGVRGIWYARNYRSKQLERELFGLRFKNPVGLAAGMDKNAELINQWFFMGFGFVEIGTVTPKPQAGNDKPRLFRLVDDQALINRMGFNNDGADCVVKRLRGKYTSLIIGGNIGKNKNTPNENALDDYRICFEKLYDYVDYFVVNVSSPNTPGLRELQERGPLTHLLSELNKLNATKPKRRPILLKIAPDLTNEQLDDIVEIVLETKIDGIIATNTTISREGLKTEAAVVQEIGAGGLSGKPLTGRSTEVIRYLRKKAGKGFPIIGVGGIHTAEDAMEKLDAGADLVQIYTGFVYEGPALINKINKKLLER
jgi:dihydroorotate dehydrogenase